MTKLKVAQIGYGYWGKNTARDLSRMPEVDLLMIHDTDAERQKAALLDHPTCGSAETVDDILRSDVEAVFIVTPPESHFALAKQVLKVGKHVWVEKPLTTRLSEAYQLINLAEKKGVILFVDHVFIYSEAVRHLKQMIETRELADIVYINARRINLGLFQYKVDVIWDLAIHDISIIDHLVGFDIEKVSVFKKKYREFPNEAFANINVDLKNGITVGINVSWLSPVKVREMVIGGRDKMVVYDDTVTDKICIYDHGIIINDKLDPRTLHEKLVQYRIGQVARPVLPGNPSLTNALVHFIDCVQHKKDPLTGKQSIINTIQALEIISKV